MCTLTWYWYGYIHTYICILSCTYMKYILYIPVHLNTYIHSSIKYQVWFEWEVFHKKRYAYSTVHQNRTEERRKRGERREVEAGEEEERWSGRTRNKSARGYQEQCKKKKIAYTCTLPDTRYFSGQKNKGPCVPVLIMMCQLIPGIYSWGIVYTIIYNINNIYIYA
jgi:hypothetical protein